MEQLMNARMNLRNAVETAESSMLEKLWAEQQQLRSEVEAIHRCLRKGGLLSDADLTHKSCQSRDTVFQSDCVPADKSPQDVTIQSGEVPAVKSLQDSMYQSDGVLADKALQDAMCLSKSIPTDKSLQDKMYQSSRGPARESLQTLLAVRAAAVCLTRSATRPLICSLRQASRSVKDSIDVIQEQKLLVIGGVDQSWYITPQDVVKSESLASESGTWEPLPAPPKSRLRFFNHAGAVLCGRIFMCGGGWAPHSAVWCYNPLYQKWQSMRSMRASRIFPAAAAIGQHLYVCGGHDGKHVWSSCERFSPFQGNDGMGEWEYLPAMSTTRQALAAVALRGQLVVCGGAHAVDGKVTRSNVTKSAEVYSPLTGMWEKMPSMAQRRAFHAAAALRGIAFVCGGAGGREGGAFFVPDASVECYDPSTQTWSRSMQMMWPRQGHSAAVLSGRLYVFGGYFEPTPHLTHVHAGHSVECFDPETGAWETAEPMSQGRAQFCAGVISQLQQSTLA
mmetsp:Transcript_18430/g.52077  ORF Transcript_18430/g.52077 Transcript_18430/m.52077 type:complete len:505 (-) Transcript_18430:561-2075(-)